MKKNEEFDREFESAQKLDFTFIGRESKLVGQFVFLGPTYLASHIEGEININGEASLRIEKMGFAKGTVRCHDIDIYGALEGKIISSGRVTIHSTANVKGEVHCKNLSIRPGATLELEAHSSN